MNAPIPQDWIKNYVDKLLAAAASFGPESSMGVACLLRADHAMDLVKAWRETGLTSPENAKPRLAKSSEIKL